MPPEDELEDAEDHTEIHHWIEGECVAEYINSAKKWEAHTSTDTFAAKFNMITEKYKD
jgi:hypothetical protein